MFRPRGREFKKKKLPRNLQAYFVANIFEANKLILNKSKP
jgi:hypothetical protein